MATKTGATKKNERVFYRRNGCRVCGSKDLAKYFDFGDMPFANSFLKSEHDEEIRAPLQVMYCNNCSNSQLSVVVNPKYLFSSYLYHSSVSETFNVHCSGLAEYAISLFGRRNLKCLDIGSNDGTLLKQFKRRDCEVIGLDPAANICEQANRDGIRTVCAFWGKDGASQIVEKSGKQDIVTATNVFAHVDDAHGFVSSVLDVLSDEGVFIVEVPYAREMVRKKEFDTIYHEHLSYFLVNPLDRLFSMHGMRICNISEFDIHGGSLRISVIKGSNSSIKINKEIVDHYTSLERKEGLNTIKPYMKMAVEVEQLKKKFLAKLKELKSKGMRIAGYGASAKGNVFLNYCGLDRDDIEFIVDDTKQKQGLLYPGTRIPVVLSSWIMEKKPDYILILAWNFTQEIMKKTEDFSKRGGKYIIAIPELKII